MLKNITIGVLAALVVIFGLALLSGNGQGGTTNFDVVDTSGGFAVDGTTVIDGDGNVDAPITSTTGTFSGDLTVDTSDLFIDVSGNVGSFGSTSPTANARAVFYESGNGGSTATSTIYLSSEHGTRGGCIQMEGWDTNEATTTYRVFVAASGTLTTEAGTCKE